MLGRPCIGWPVVLKHVLDQVDAPAGRIHFVAQGHIGRTSRRAETAVDAVAQNSVRLGDVRISQLGKGKMCLHVRRPYDLGLKFHEGQNSHDSGGSELPEAQPAAQRLKPIAGWPRRRVPMWRGRRHCPAPPP